MTQFDYKRIFDPVHGTIGLSKLEVNLINTKSFLRLQNVKQLGLAHHVFPSADYSRFSHALGVCHVTGAMLINFRDKGGLEISDGEIQLYRLAALLHDIGHYPYSHAMEYPIKDRYAEEVLVKKPFTSMQSSDNSKLQSLSQAVRSFDHERVGKEILVKDPSIKSILKEAKIEPTKVSSIFMREKPPILSNLVSSDLDADRIDYLLRTSHHTGLPFGLVDLRYLLNQMRMDNSSKICFTLKALQSIDHFLLCRYFDYQQIPFNKTVVGLEIILKKVIADLLHKGDLNCSADDITKMIEDDTWFDFDDSFVFQKIRELSQNNIGDIIQQEAKAIVERIPPKLVFDLSYVSDRNESSITEFKNYKALLSQKIEEWAKKYSVDRDRWYIWDKGLDITKVSSFVPTSIVIESNHRELTERLSQSVRIVNRNNEVSTPITEIKRSLMSVLADKRLYNLRLYVLLNDEEKLKDEIALHIKTEFEDWDIQR